MKLQTSRRGAMAMLAAGALTTPKPAASQGRGAVLVMNSGAASLSVLDMSSRKELRRIPVLREPHHRTLTPDKRELLIGDSSGNELIVLDPVTFDLKRRVPISNPYHLDFSPNGRFFVIAGLARNQVDVYEAGTYKLLKRFAVRSMPSHMDFLPDSSAVFVSLQGSGRVVAIDLIRLEERWNEPCGKAPAGVMVHNGQVLACNMGADDVAVMDARSGKVQRRVRTGKGAHTLFWSPDRRAIWVNSRLDIDSVTVLDAATLEPRRRYRLPGGPDDLEFAPDGKVWFTMRFIHKVAVLDPATGDHVTIDVGRSPHGIFLNGNALVSG